ncbi:MAG TPA: hypothetical protein PL110_07365 [Candidatus Eremiobacteraeota bacterium]|nr:hypothetical protein [Candidatus Eremiobacteraeota bacterium]
MDKWFKEAVFFAEKQLKSISETFISTFQEIGSRSKIKKFMCPPDFQKKKCFLIDTLKDSDHNVRAKGAKYLKDKRVDMLPDTGLTGKQNPI